jgi:hypothetical protein
MSDSRDLVTVNNAMEGPIVSNGNTWDYDKIICRNISKCRKIGSREIRIREVLVLRTACEEYGRREVRKTV